MVPITLHVPTLMQPAIGDSDIFYPGQDMRNLIAGLLKFPGTQGVCGPNSFNVTQRGAGANFSVDIAAGYAFCVGDDITNQGTYGLWSDATYNLVTPSAPSSGSRTHRVILQVRDKAANGAYTTYDFQPQLLQDTGSGTPALPASALNLAFVTISNGDPAVHNSSITDKRPRVDDIAVFKTSNQSLGTTTTLTNDSDLALNGFIGSGVYEVTGAIVYDAGTVSQYQFGWNLPSGSTWVYTAQRVNTTGGTGSAAFTGAGGVNCLGNGSGSLLGLQIQGLLTLGSSSGTMQYQFANYATGGAGPTDYAGSYLKAHRIA